MGAQAMGYVIQRNESVIKALRRVATEQIDRALQETAADGLERNEAVHQARKRCKKIRALLRLVRPAFEPSYAEENAWYRDAARELSWVRDAQSVLDTHVALVQRHGEQLDAAAMAQVTAWLTQRRDAVAADRDKMDVAIARFRQRLEQGRDRVQDWSLRDRGFDAVAGGVLETHRRGRRAMAQAYAAPSTEHFHEWRKRVKYHWYHMRLLRNLHPTMVRAQRDQADRLGECLGEEHDLAVLSALLAEADGQWPVDTTETLLALAQQRRQQLRERARRPGALLYCEKPKRLRQRLACYWQLTMKS